MINKIKNLVSQMVCYLSGHSMVSTNTTNYVGCACLRCGESYGGYTNLGDCAY